MLIQTEKLLQSNGILLKNGNLCLFARTSRWVELLQIPYYSLILLLSKRKNTDTMVPIYLLLAIPLLLVLVGVEMLVNWIKDKKHFTLPDTLTNLSCGIGNQGLNLFTEGLKIALYVDFYEHFALFHLPNTFWAFVLCLLLFDLAFYWEHRLSHVINILWGTHVVHHSSEEYNLTIALRRSWIADIIVIVFFLPIPLFGFDPVTFGATVIVHNVYQFIIHTRSVKKLPWIVEYIMHTPSHHRVHHGKDPKYIDKNFSGVFIIYDRIFNTFKEEEEEPTYGITTQLTTNNPALVNIHYYRDLFKKVGQARGIGDKLRLLFGKPGWHPEYMGGYIAPPEVDKQTYKK
jgi:sterol desaturase/sphingolipid hydroxylase (fatty acid hydroxylase superfamily)